MINYNRRLIECRLKSLEKEQPEKPVGDYFIFWVILLLLLWLIINYLGGK
jgi:hypothetical protein